MGWALESLFVVPSIISLPRVDPAGPGYRQSKRHQVADLIHASIQVENEFAVKVTTLMFYYYVYAPSVW